MDRQDFDVMWTRRARRDQTARTALAGQEKAARTDDQQPASDGDGSMPNAMIAYGIAAGASVAATSGRTTDGGDGGPKDVVMAAWRRNVSTAPSSTGPDDRRVTVTRGEAGSLAIDGSVEPRSSLSAVRLGKGEESGIGGQRRVSSS